MNSNAIPLWQQCIEPASQLVFYKVQQDYTGSVSHSPMKVSNGGVGGPLAGYVPLTAKAPILARKEAPRWMSGP